MNATFGSLVSTNVPSNFGTSLSYDANDAFLNLTPNFASSNFGSRLNYNQQAAGKALTNFFNANRGIPLVYRSCLLRVSRKPAASRPLVRSCAVQRDETVHGHVDRSLHCGTRRSG